MRPCASALFGVVALLSACSEGDHDGRPVAEVSDSASIRIVTYSHLDSSAAGIDVDSVPIFRVGWDDSGRLFDRIEDVTVLGSGEVAVSDGRGAQEVVILDRSGGVRAVLGGKGEGPGEFAGISRLVPWGGGLVAQDYMLARATEYDGSDDVGTYSLPYLDHKAILGRAGDLFVLGPPLMLVNGRRYPERWRRVAVTTSAPPFSAEDTVVVVDWDQSLEFNGRDPWASSGMAVFDGEHVIYGRGDRPELIWYGLDGVPTQIVRWSPPPMAVSDSAYSAFEDYYLGLVGGGMSPQDTRDGMERMSEQHQGVAPYFDELFVDGGGTVWLGQFLRPEQRTEEFTRTYYLFSPNGETLGTVLLSAELRVRDITDDLVAGYELGRYNEPAAVAYRINKAAPQPPGS